MSESERKGLLLATNGGKQNGSRHLRAPSEAPSTASSRTHVTIRDDRTEDPFLSGNKPLQRRHTQIVNLKISRWDCFLGWLLSPKITAKRVRATLETSRQNEEDDEDGFNDKDIPFLITIHVAEHGSNSTYQQTRCLYDTGCLQGNLISKAFAERLGFTPSHFKQLTPREKNGGISGTGHSHVPVGALYLTWYNNRDNGIFRKMRFLVSDALSPQHELIIGARTILDYNLLNSLFLPIASNTGVVVVPIAHESDEMALKSDIEKLTSDIETAEGKMKKAKKEKDKTIWPQKIEKMKTDLKLKQTELSVLKAQKAVNKDSSKKNQDQLDACQKELAELKKKAKDEKSRPKKAPTNKDLESSA
ncbi:hypothetical protein BGZ60DRAFT_530965 [Tricladium varicosporioides]|nr:hypothetical protein BGZ60DRAFT_530965 [Hymenoscyphus varicosporioides]